MRTAARRRARRGHEGLVVEHNSEPNTARGERQKRLKVLRVGRQQQQTYRGTQTTSAEHV